MNFSHGMERKKYYIGAWVSCNRYIPFFFLTRISQKTRNSFIADFCLTQISRISRKAALLTLAAVGIAECLRPEWYTQAVARVFREIREICVRHIIYFTQSPFRFTRGRFYCVTTQQLLRRDENFAASRRSKNPLARAIVHYAHETFGL